MNFDISTCLLCFVKIVEYLALMQREEERAIGEIILTAS